MKFEENTESDILCPDCNPPRKLIVKTNRLNDGQFLGCPNFPECNYTRDIPEAWKMRAAGQVGLFDNLPTVDNRKGVYCRNCEDVITYGEMKPFIKDDDMVDMICADCGAVLVEDE